MKALLQGFPRAAGPGNVRELARDFQGARTFPLSGSHADSAHAGGFTVRARQGPR